MKNNLSNFELLQKLGSGAYSTVYKARRKIDGQIYALKIVKLADLEEREKQNTLNEIRFISSIRHQNIVAYKECFIDEGTSQLCLVMEYAQHGDLYQKIKRQIKQEEFVGESEIWGILIQKIISGLKVLHDQHIFHRDLKCANIFLFSNNVVKIGDFNVSKLVKQGFAHTQTGTPYYASPEVWSDQSYNHKTDIWSLGCVLYEVCALKPPFQGADMKALCKSVIKGVYKPIPDIYSQDLSKTIKLMLNTVPKLRPDCDRLLALPQIVKQQHLSNSSNETSVNLMKTIIWPKLSQNKSQLVQLTPFLPKSNYSSINQLNSNHLRKRKYGSQTRKISTDEQNLNETMKKLVDEIEKINQNEKLKQHNQKKFIEDEIIQEKNYLSKPVKRKNKKMLSDPGDIDSRVLIKREQNYSHLDPSDNAKINRIRNTNSEYVQNLIDQSINLRNESKASKGLPQLRKVEGEYYQLVQLIKRPKKKQREENYESLKFSINLGKLDYGEKEMLSVSQLKGSRSVEKSNNNSLPKLQKIKKK